ncbi:MAG: hydantoinase/oxoprolinase family protein [Rhodospirillaceae bacterium]|nr:hydantoinase/oxoprolinase family protein [Rhodospirillaceae bacterium]MBT4687247.1 hydantoinase/oxoprolinase family protein [Rhodospirillaceae bacterium]MBT5082722.1 hydantoinase/oxoprolinase family protein [Rhodospirillaceae bacterium]MBT5524114.1 hydantoinase/oxoprolinase family protein [Rhodospirillaceae bacterium]MBT5880791.1 hydantoinase/oxoprolinase family protein [Rhodospirillaceae bacterium]
MGVDVGGTFTDLLLIDEGSGHAFTAKVPSTPEDSSQGVLFGIEKICAEAGLDPTTIDRVMHGTTVATNTVLTGNGALVGLITTKGYKQVLQIARSYVPGGLGGWVIFNKSDPLAPLELTIEAHERMSALGEVVQPLDEKAMADDIATLKDSGVEALTISLVNAYANGEHEQRIRTIAERVLPGIPVSISSEVIPEMYEYERAETTVVNSYIRPVVAKYIENLERELDSRMNGVQLHILRSDGGLASAEAAKAAPVNLLMSGPAGGVSGAIWIAKQAGYENLLTFDMGGTSTDVALIEGGVARTRRETRVADVTVRASSIDVRTVGAGGGSIAYVPELTKALRVGPQSAGAEPGPAAYGKGGEEPTVTDANVVLGYLPSGAKLGGDMQLDYAASERAMKKVADGMGLGIKEAAEGIVNIVNENMFGALRLVSVEQGYDPRDFALVGFGGAGPLHANALGKLMGSWPVMIPPGPGVLCAYGDATTRVRDEASRTFVRRFEETSDGEVRGILEELAEIAAHALDNEGVARADQTTLYQIDLRYAGQAMQLTVDMTPEDYGRGGLVAAGTEFNAIHEQMFTFSLETGHELYNLRALVQGRESSAKAETLQTGGDDPSAAAYMDTSVYVEGRDQPAKIYDRSKLLAGNRIPGPAIVTEMDSTTLILPNHEGEVDNVGNILIRPI